MIERKGQKVIGTPPAAKPDPAPPQPTRYAVSLYCTGCNNEWFWYRPCFCLYATGDSYLRVEYSDGTTGYTGHPHTTGGQDAQDE